MGYNNESTGTSSRSHASAGEGTKRAQLLRMNLFKPTREGVTSVASGQFQITSNIPAGSYINIYKTDLSKMKYPNPPDFTLVVTEGVLKEKKD